MAQQMNFTHTDWRHRYSHGGDLRRKRNGRKSRPLSTKDPLHLVFKIQRAAIPKGLRHPRIQTIVNQVLRQYSKKFFVKIVQVSIQHDHIHCLVSAPKRASFQSFFRVVAGQISQRVTGSFRESYRGARVWKARPFSRVVKGWRAYRIVRNYFQLNEQEAKGRINYQKDRLKDLTSEQVQELWEGSS